LSGSDLAVLCQHAAMADIRALSEAGTDFSREPPRMRIVQARLREALAIVRRGRDARTRR
jgi:hypothetical protein